MFDKVWKSKSVLVPSTQRQEPVAQLLLPGEISGRILDLEMQCQKQSFTTEVIFELVNNYTKAVEFYEQRGNQKYKLYQKRMHKFLQKPLVQSILRGESGEMIIKKEKAQETVRKAENKAEQQVKELLQMEEQKMKEHQSKVKVQIQKQELKLEERKRKRAMSNRSARSRRESIENEESGKKEQMNMKILLEGINERTQVNSRKVYF